MPSNAGSASPPTGPSRNISYACRSAAGGQPHGFWPPAQPNTAQENTQRFQLATAAIRGIKSVARAVGIPGSHRSERGTSPTVPAARRLFQSLDGTEPSTSAAGTRLFLPSRDIFEREEYHLRPIGRGELPAPAKLPQTLMSAGHDIAPSHEAAPSFYRAGGADTATMRPRPPPMNDGRAACRVCCITLTVLVMLGLAAEIRFDTNSATISWLDPFHTASAGTSARGVS